MYQIYLLAVLVNIAGGVLLAVGFLKEKIPALEGLEAFLAENKAFVTIASLIMLALGVLKLIIPASPSVPVAQDLIPALLAIVSGITLFYGHYKKVSDVDSEATSFMDKYVYKYRDVIGILTLLSGLVHFILPRVVLL